jgi:hypothetical protein
MFCPQCGNNVPDGATFCAACGCSVAVGAPVTDSAPVQQPQPAPEYPQNTYAPAQKGCVSQAWSDIVSSPNWVKRILLLMVMNCVPILDLYAGGYTLQWGSDAARGKAGSLPVGSFDRKTILLGLVPFLLTILLLLGVTVLLLFCVIPILGYIICFVGIVMANAFYYMALLRVGATGKVASAFDLSELFRAYRKNLGGLVFATLIPGILGGLVVTVIVLIIITIVTLLNYPTFANMSSYTQLYFANNPLELLGFSVSFLIAFVLAVLIAFLVQGFVDLWTMRAVGHWVNRTVPEWAAEAAEAAGAAEVAGTAEAAEATGAAEAEHPSKDDVSGVKVETPVE